MAGVTKTHFVKDQGFPVSDAGSCDLQYPALMFQPRLIGIIVAVGMITQSPVVFLTMAVLLAWNVLVPRWNPFDALYAILVARPRGLSMPGPAPAPRRFAQGMAATFMLGIGLSLLGGYTVLAVVLEILLAAALLALIVGRFCLGSYVYHLIYRGNDRSLT
jgi:hypothetical protein